MFDRVQQARVDPPELRQHPRIQHVALAIVLVDHTKLARVRYDHLVPEILQEPARPRAVRSDLDDDARTGVLLREPPKRLAVVADLALVDDLATGVDRTDRVAPLARIDSDRDTVKVRLRGRTGGGIARLRSGVGFHGQGESRRPRRLPLPSHLNLFAL